MAYIRITPVAATVSGAAPVAETTDAVEGNVVSNVPSLVLVFTNADEADSATITFVTSATVEGYAVVDHTVTIPAASTLAYGSFPRTVFGTELEFTTSAPLSLNAYR